ncbi:MAG: hypothetical protein ACE14V_10720 [bacterium]
MGPGEAALTNGAIMVGLIIGCGYLLVFPFWMIYKLERIMSRLRYMQEDLDEQDDILKRMEQRLEILDIDVETRRKEIIEAVSLFQGKQSSSERPN